MLNDFEFFLASMACIAGFLTPLWIGGLYCIRAWISYQYPMNDDAPER